MKTSNVKYVLLWGAVVFALLGSANVLAGIVPYPNRLEWQPGEYCKSKELNVYCDSFFDKEIQKVMDDWATKQKFVYSFSRREKADLVVLFCADVIPEGYTIDVGDSGITIEASTCAGLFYAIATLKQLVQQEVDKLSFPCVAISDFPAFSWRGFLLDEARNFLGKEEVKNLLDEMALLKMNVFHWHLTDDQGWRIEIKKYPRLTEIGGRRDSTQLNWYESNVYDGVSMSGYYTQQDIREVIAYAAERHITVVPEIEFPGHASAAIAAYPWLGCLQKEITVPCNYGVFSSVFNIADERVMHFIQDVLDEISELFPSNVIHIGGDEVKYDEWQDSEAIKQLMEREQISSLPELQIWFSNRLSAYLKQKGKVMMGWNDITGDKVHAYQPQVEIASSLDVQNTIVQFWQGNIEILEKALDRGFKIVNSQCDYTYLNYNYDKIVPGLEYGYNPISMEKAYFFSPIPKGMKNNRNLILGLTCAMWGEWIYRPEIMYKMVYPQIAAYAEAGWTLQENKDFDRFQTSLVSLEERWRAVGYIQ